MYNHYNKPILKIPHETESPTDAAQYMVYRGLKQYNLCMEFCVAYCMRDDEHTDNIDDYLAYWEVKDPIWWKTIFKNNLARTTGMYDIKKALEAYEAETMEWKPTPSNMIPFRVMLDTHHAIMGVHIDYTGYLVGQGIPHWVVLEQLDVRDPKHAIVDVYNPFTNLIESYSWRELMNSSGSYKQCLWVKRSQ
jgi:hypothetical protein